MLGSFRKFSNSIYAKVVLGIVVIPFVFWGMGSVFTGGNQNIVVKIDKDKYSVEEFTNYIERANSGNTKIDKKKIDELLSTFIGDKLINKEVERYGITLSDKSLSQLIYNQEEFKRDDKFSRLEYEKFLLKNNMTAVNFENNLAQFEKKKQLLTFIGGGVVTPDFLINNAYNKINQKRDIKLINLKNFLEKKSNFTDNEINLYYENNKEQFKETFKVFKILELKPQNLVNAEEYNSKFFEKIDKIDDGIVGGENLDQIINFFNLEDPNVITINSDGKDVRSREISLTPKKLVDRIFNISEQEPTTLIEIDNKYYVIQLEEVKIIEKDIKDVSVKQMVISDLKRSFKRELVSNLISRINKNKFTKKDFDKFANEEKLNIQSISLNNRNDITILKEGLTNQIYSFPKNSVFLVNDIGLVENYLVYVDKIRNVDIKKESDEYANYLNLSKAKVASDVYNSYDIYIKNNYKIDINFNTLDKIKNYFN